jgi:septum formation protein
MNKIVLASQSPRRGQLLEWAEIPFEVIARPTDETFPDQLSITGISIHIARQKALAVQHELPAGRVVLAADTIVVLGNRIIGKPSDRDDALSILSALSGQEHAVVTGVVIRQDNKESAFSDSTLVRFHELTKEQISFYIDKYKPYDKAGAYAIQEWIGVIGIESVTGDFYNVMGLPVSRVVKELQQFK